MFTLWESSHIQVNLLHTHKIILSRISLCGQFMIFMLKIKLAQFMIQIHVYNKCAHIHTRNPFSITQLLQE